MSRPFAVLRPLCGLLVLLLIALPILAQDGAMVRAARSQFDSGNFSAAIAMLRGEVSSHPQDAAGHYWLGRCYYEIRDYDNAAAQEEQAVKLDPQNSAYHQWLGRAYGDKASREHSFFVARKVKHEFEEAVRLNPKNIEVRRNLAAYLLQAPWILGGSRDEAKSQVDAIAALDPVQGHLARAEFWATQKRSDLADTEYRAVLQANPSILEPYLEIANYYQRQWQLPGLAAATQAAERIAPADPRMSFYRGAVLVVSNAQLSEAEQDLKSYLASTADRSDWPPHAAARELLGIVYEHQGKRMQAAEQYRAAVQLDPDRWYSKQRLKHLDRGSQ